MTSDPFKDDSRWTLVGSRFDTSDLLLDLMAEDDALRPLVEGIRKGQAAAKRWLDSDRSTPVVDAFYQSLDEDAEWGTA